MGPPAITPVAMPVALIVATAVFEAVQFTVTGPVELSEKWPVAVNVCVAPVAMEAVGGATVIEVNVGGAGVTVNCAVPLIDGTCVEVAVIVMGPPAVTPDATPAVLIVAMDVFEELQFTLTGEDELSEKCPVAANCCVAPTATEAVVGATVIEVSVGAAAVTVN